MVDVFVPDIVIKSRSEVEPDTVKVDAVNGWLELPATEIAQKLGVRFVTVDALYDPDTDYDVSDYYRRWGFEYAYPDEPLPPPEGFRTLYLDLLPFIDALK